MRKSAPKLCPGCRETTRSANAVLCMPCWRRTPKRLRDMFRSASTRVAAVKLILDHHRREREEPRLGGI